MTHADLAARLAEHYGPDPGLVGAEDGTEDDYGDLLCETYEALVGPMDGTEDDALWQHFQQIAGRSRCTTYEGWLAELQATVDIYGKDGTCAEQS